MQVPFAPLAGAEGDVLWRERALVAVQANMGVSLACPVCFRAVGSLAQQLQVLARHSKAAELGKQVELPPLEGLEDPPAKGCALCCSEACRDRASAGSLELLLPREAPTERPAVSRKRTKRTPRRSVDPARKLLNHAEKSGHAASLMLAARLATDALLRAAGASGETLDAAKVWEECAAVLTLPVPATGPWWELLSSKGRPEGLAAAETGTVAVESREHGGKIQLVVAALVTGGADDTSCSRELFDAARSVWKALLETLADRRPSSQGKPSALRRTLPFRLFGELLRIIELAALDFELGRSPLAQYAQALTKAPAPIQEEVLATLRPIVPHIEAGHAALRAEEERGPLSVAVSQLVSALATSSTTRVSDEDDALAFGSLRLMPEEQAQLTHVVLLPRILSDMDVAAILELGVRQANGGQALVNLKTGNPNWRTQYLTAFRSDLPELAAKIEAKVREADTAHWQLLDGRPCVTMRCVELHDVSVEGALAEPKHFDRGSILTVDVMLSSDGDFEGGAFQTLEANGQLQAHAFGKGDALVWVSHKYHCVAPVVSGRRRVLVIEFWQGRERRCSHRCTTHWGTCPLEPAAASEGTLASAQELAARADGLFPPCAGVALFPRLAALLGRERDEGEGASAAPNVTVRFSPGPEAELVALRPIKAGEALRLARPSASGSFAVAQHLEEPAAKKLRLLP